MIDLDELERAAHAATPGPWESNAIYLASGEPYPRVDAKDGRVADAQSGGRSEEQCLANAAYIALANPAAVLELVARVRAAEAAQAVLDALFQRSHDLVLVRQQDGTWHGGAELELAEGRTWHATVAELVKALGGQNGS